MKNWAGAGSNRRHMDFQSIALPTELPARGLPEAKDGIVFPGADDSSTRETVKREDVKREEARHLMVHVFTFHAFLIAAARFGRPPCSRRVELPSRRRRVD